MRASQWNNESRRREEIDYKQCSRSATWLHRDSFANRFGKVFKRKPWLPVSHSKMKIPVIANDTISPTKKLKLMAL